MLSSFLLALFGSLGHCVGMCSAVVLLFDRQPSFRRRGAWILAHAGRITTYATMGLIFGALGESLRSLDKAQAFLSIGFAIVAFYMASSFIGLTPSPELLFSPLTQRWGKAMRGFKSDSFFAPFFLGLIWGFLPCGLVLTALLAAMASTNVLYGALTMIVFGVGTLPSLLGARWLAGQLSARTWSRGLVSLLMTFFGFQFAMRGFAALGLVEHFMFMDVMFW